MEDQYIGIKTNNSIRFIKLSNLITISEGYVEYSVGNEAKYLNITKEESTSLIQTLRACDLIVNSEE